ncbi:MAG: alcohol dehydrogenase catalytic domain-containing protein [bacterium]|nr:alcohol dehydrogenase catalytic domain-containing protein [bacterium]
MMQAGYLVAPGRVELRSVPAPQAGAGEVVLRIRAALTDGTDLKAFRRGHPQMPMPTRFGHEFSGDVLDAGAGVTRFKAGDAVMAVHSAPCGECYWCRAEQENLCERVMETKILGAYAEQLLVPAHIVERNAFVKPPSLSYEAAACLEPLACVVHNLSLLRPRSGDLALIIGTGGFGLLHAIVLRALGLRVAVIGRNAERTALAKALGAEWGKEMALDPQSIGEARALISEISGGRGADRAIECTGAVNGWLAALATVRRGGIVSLFGGPPPGSTVPVDTSRIHYDQIELVSPFHFRPQDVRRAYQLLAEGSIDVEPLISARVPLAQLGDAFVRLEHGEGVKFAVIP